MGDAILLHSELSQSNTRRDLVTHDDSIAQKLDQTASKNKRVQFPPDDSLVQIHEISPRRPESSDSNESSETSESSESENESESDTSTSSTEIDSDDEAEIPIKNRSISEKIQAAKNKTSQNSINPISTLTSNTKHNNALDKVNHRNRKIPGDAKQKLNLSITSSQSAPKQKTLTPKLNPAPPSSNISRSKTFNFSNIGRRSSAPASTKRTLLPARKAANSRRGSDEYLIPSLTPSIMQIDYDRDALLKSFQSLTVEDGFIFPSLQTYDMKLPKINHPPTNIENFKQSGASGDHLKISLPPDHRFNAWQMANGRAEDALETRPDIAQLWDSAPTTSKL